MAFTDTANRRSTPELSLYIIHPTNMMVISVVVLVVVGVVVIVVVELRLA